MTEDGILWIGMMAALVAVIALLGAPWFEYSDEVVSTVVQTIRDVALFAAGFKFRSQVQFAPKQTP